MFFPEERGIAHVTRSLAVAEQLRMRGHAVLVALSTDRAALLGRTPVNIVPIDRFVLDNDIASIERIRQPSILADLVRKEQAVIDSHQPDCIVVDLRISAIVSAISRSLPTFMITGSMNLPGGCHIPNPGLPAPLYKCALPLIRSRLRKAQLAFLDPLSKAAASVGSSFVPDDLLTRVSYVVPEVPGYLPGADEAVDIHHCGPILWDGFEHDSPPWLQEISPNGRTVYLSFGGTGHDGSRLVGLSTALVERGFRVVVSCGHICPPGMFPRTRDLYVETYLPGVEVCKRVDVVVCHGGYGTMMQAVAAGRPIVAVPSNVEQLVNALRCQEMGVATCLTDIDVVAMMRLRVRALMDLGRNVSMDAIMKSVVRSLRGGERYGEAAEAFAREVRSANGCTAAAAVIEEALAGKGTGRAGLSEMG